MTDFSKSNLVSFCFPRFFINIYIGNNESTTILLLNNVVNYKNVSESYLNLQTTRFFGKIIGLFSSLQYLTETRNPLLR
jgi:hypothetical protein